MIERLKIDFTNMNKLFPLFLSAVALGNSDIDTRDASDPNYTLVDNQSLQFPLGKKDYWNWSAAGSAVFLESRAVLAPEASGQKGLVHTLQPNSKKDHWYAVFDFNIGRDNGKVDKKSDAGIGIYYLKNFD